ncbi:hypothetical protein RHGRI_002343 [Rhododendron griersonianum]|uniref:Thioredoxin domain-containing protein n=1 Tax=Rhododendron griersonianum TaxID=479676 RepID=A0AAV6LNN7_9ERIC|nr:hypothetical protein RHGRI_002343 [Rhododendron griersonianum]
MKLYFHRSLILLSFLLLVVFSLLVAEAEVITLTEETFNDKVKEKDTAWFVRFCVPWCKHCKNLGSLWEDLGKEMEREDEIEVGQVDCGTSKPLCSKVDIHSYPTFKLFYNGEEVAKYQACRFGYASLPYHMALPPHRHSSPNTDSVVLRVVTCEPSKLPLVLFTLWGQAMSGAFFADLCYTTGSFQRHSWKLELCNGTLTLLHRTRSRGTRDVESLRTFVLEEAEKAATNSQLENEKEL